MERQVRKMFDGPRPPLISRRRFALRMASFALAAIIVDGIVLLVGAVDYHFC